MLLVIDIGNTNIVFGVFDQDQLVCKFRMGTSHTTTEDEYATFLMPILTKQGLISRINAAAISSVVPTRLSFILLFVERYITKKIYMLKHDNHNLQILTDSPYTLGKDLVANAIGAHALYKRSCLIVDIGTATTFSLIKDNGGLACYIGGAIAPGPGTMLHSLHTNTAQLPNIPLTLPDNVCCKNTADAMSAGIFFGCIEMIDGIITRFQDNENHYDIPLYVIVTGGFSNMLWPYIKHVDIVEPNLTLIGLKFFYLQHNEGTLH